MPGGGQLPGGATQADYDDIRDYARQAGLDLSHLPDSRAAADYLLQLARANNAYLEYGRQLAPYYSQFTQWLQSQQQGGGQQGQQQQQRPANPFGIPEYDPGWLELVERDANGNWIPKPGAPPDIVFRIQNYSRARQAALDRLLSNPADVLGPVLQQAIQPMLQQYLQQNLGHYQDQQFANQFVSQNSQWLHMRDQNGNIITDPITRTPVLTNEGHRFLQHLRKAEEIGIRSLQDQQAYAMNMLRAEGVTSIFGTSGASNATQQRDASNQNFLNQHNRRQPNHSGSATNLPNGDPPPNPGLSLRERLLKNLQTNGITDQMIAAEGN